MFMSGIKALYSKTVTNGIKFGNKCLCLLSHPAGSSLL